MTNDISNDDLRWTVHPAATHPVRSAVAVMIISMIAGALYQFTDGLLYIVIVVLVLLTTLSPFFIPARYLLTRDGISCRRMGRSKFMKWTEMRSRTVSDGAIYVSPYPARSIRQGRGILILCPDNYDDVVEYIKKVAIV
ncbi:hypothetical protein K8T06_17890 [bacterium]|nr:hypothetical protein [bacterium]